MLELVYLARVGCFFLFMCAVVLCIILAKTEQIRKRVGGDDRL